jgi:hypothetical protein
VDAPDTSVAPTAASKRYKTRPPTHRYPTRAQQPVTRMPTRSTTQSSYAAAAMAALLQQEHRNFLPHLANSVLHPKTGRIMSYDNLVRDPKTEELWSGAMTKELARLSQGIDGLTEGTNTVFYMSHDDIKHIPEDRTVTYARVVVDYRPQKADPNRVRITVGGNLITYPGEVTTRCQILLRRCQEFLSGNPYGSLRIHAYSSTFDPEGIYGCL